MEKAAKGFQVTGIYPLNPHIFDEDEIQTSVPIVKEPSTSVIPVSRQENIETTVGNSLIEYRTLHDDDSTRSLPASPSIFEELIETEPIATNATIHDLTTGDINEPLSCLICPTISNNVVGHNDGTKPSTSRCILEELSPIPQKVIKMKRRTKKQHSVILTATPLKEQLEVKEKKRNMKELKKTEIDKKGKTVRGKKLAKGKSVKRKVFSESDDSVDYVPGLNTNRKHRNLKQTPKNHKKKKTIKQVAQGGFSSSDSDGPLVNLCNDDENDDVENRNSDLCAICGEFGRDREMWFRCCLCSNWIHKDCSGKDSADNFVCDLCEY